MKKTIILKSGQLKNKAMEVLRVLPVEPLHEVIIRPHKETLSSRQRRTYWEWLTIIGADLGYTKDEIHEEYKGLLLVKIFYRDDKSYAALIDSVHDNDNIKQVVKLTSITKANTKQMAEYMTDIDRHAAGLGIHLPHPGDNRAH